MKTFLFILAITITQISYAQDPQLFENTWYLENINIDGMQINAPSNDEVPFVDLLFIKEDIFNTNVCNFAQAQVNFSQTEDNFEISNMIISLIDCNNQVNTVFENDYFQDFFGPNFIFDNPFGYEVTTGTGNSKQLVLTSASGNTATYNNTLLALNKQDIEGVTFFPNPVMSTMAITAQTSAIKEITIFNLAGQEVWKKALEGENKSELINLSSLNDGLYFAQIKDHSGKTQIVRFIKQ